MPCRGGTRQRCFYFFYNFFAGCLTEGAPGKEFFLFFFVISLPGARSWGTRQRFFFLKKLCRVPWTWHSAKLGIPEFPALLSARDKAPGKASKIIFFILFFDSIITNTAYKRYISHLKHHKDNIAHIYHIHLITNSIPHIYITSRIQYLTYTTSQT